MAKCFFCKFIDRDVVKVHKHTQKERGQYPPILTEQAWSIKNLLYGFQGNFSCGTQQVVAANHFAGFSSSCPLTELHVYPDNKYIYSLSKLLNVHTPAGLICTSTIAGLSRACLPQLIRHIYHIQYNVREGGAQMTKFVSHQVVYTAGASSGFYNMIYHMASSLSGQDEPNPVL